MDKFDLNYFPILNYNHGELFNVDLFLDWNNKKRTFLIDLDIPVEMSVITINWMKWTQELIKLSSIDDLLC
jgi:hypothetical protein